MAKVQTYRPHVECDAVMTLNIHEMRALRALTCYGIDPLLAHFYKHMGQSYLKPYEHGLRSFLEAAASVNLSAVEDAERALRTHWIEGAKAKSKPRYEAS